MPKYIRLLLPFIKAFTWLQVNFVEGLAFQLWWAKFRYTRLRAMNLFLRIRLAIAEWRTEGYMNKIQRYQKLAKYDGAYCKYCGEPHASNTCNYHQWR